MGRSTDFEIGIKDLRHPNIFVYEAPTPRMNGLPINIDIGYSRLIRTSMFIRSQMVSQIFMTSSYQLNEYKADSVRLFFG